LYHSDNNLLNENYVFNIFKIIAINGL